VLAIAVLLRTRGSHGGAASTTTVTAPARRDHALLPVDKLMSEARAKAGPTSGPEATTWSVEEAVGQALDADPQLRAFYNLRRKALRTAAEQQEYLAMISDAKRIDEARDDLLAAVQQRDVEQVEEVRRLQHIQYLNSALAWSENPARTRALGAVTDVINQDVPHGTAKPVVGSVLGDKFDLFQLLVVTDREHARALLDQAQGTTRATVLQLAWQTGNADLPTGHNPQP
jgi:hypothetical protein